MNCAILAGGLGTRLRQEVPGLPKTLAPVRGRPFLEFLLEYWAEQGVERFILCVGHLSSQIESRMGETWQRIPIQYSREDTPLGTAGALLKATKLISDKDPFLCVNGDTFAETDLARMIAAHRSSCSKATLSVGSRTPSSKDRYGGVKLADDGRITEFKGNSPYFNRGVYLFDPGYLRAELDPRRPLSLENELLPSWIRSGARIHGLVQDGLFIDIGVPEDYRRVEGALEPWLRAKKEGDS